MKRGYLDRPGCRLYYEVSGAGPMLVFAHGLGGNHLSWWQQVPHFQDRYTCVTFAHRGFSPSSAPPGGPDPAEYAGDLAALVDHLGGSDIRIVAQSMGGWTALEYAYLRPGSVRALVMASTAGSLAWPAWPFPDPDQVARWRTQSEASAQDLFRRGLHPASGERMAREQPAAEFLYRAIDALSTGLDKGMLRQRLMAALRRPIEPLRSFDVPTLWLTGEEDNVYPPFVSDALAPLMPNARVACVPNAGHSVYFERPAEFNRVVDEFLARNP